MSVIGNLSRLNLLSYLIISGISLRWILDGANLGIIGSMFIFISFGFFLCTAKNIEVPKKFAYFIAIVLAIFSFSYINVWYRHSEIFYQLKPLMRYLSYIFVFVLCFNLNIKSKTIYKLFTILIIIQFIVCLYQVIILQESRPSGTLQNNNHINYLLVSYIIVTFFVNRNYFKIVFSTLFLLSMKGMGGVVSLILAIFIYIFFDLKGIKKIYYTIIPLLMIFISSFFLQERINEQLMVVNVDERIQAGQSGGDGGSLVWRIVTWSQHLEYLKKESALTFGLGIDTSSSVSPYSTPASSFDPHSDYILMIIDYGLLLTSIFLLYSVSILLFTFYRRKKSIVYECQFYLMIVLMAGAFVGNILTQSSLMLILFSLFGSLYREMHNDRFY